MKRPTNNYFPQLKEQHLIELPTLNNSQQIQTEQSYSDHLLSRTPQVGITNNVGGKLNLQDGRGFRTMELSSWKERKVLIGYRRGVEVKQNWLKVQLQSNTSPTNKNKNKSPTINQTNQTNTKIQSYHSYQLKKHNNISNIINQHSIKLQSRQIFSPSNNKHNQRYGIQINNQSTDRKKQKNKLQSISNHSFHLRQRNKRKMAISPWQYQTQETLLI